MGVMGDSELLSYGNYGAMLVMELMAARGAITIINS